MKKLLTTLSILLITTASYAETITLTSGKVIEGQIVERTDEFIKVKLGTTSLIATYWLDEVDAIDQEAVVLSEVEDDEQEKSLQKKYYPYIESKVDKSDKKFLDAYQYRGDSVYGDSIDGDLLKKMKVSQEIESNQYLAMSRLRSMWTASEVYATANNGVYPVNMALMVEADPPYITKDYCGPIKGGFTIQCNMFSSHYSYMAIPDDSNVSGNTVYLMPFGGGLEIRSLDGDLPIEYEIVKDEDFQKEKRIWEKSGKDEYVNIWGCTKDGVNKNYDRTGKVLITEFYCKDGKMEGLFKTYFANGQLEGEGIIVDRKQEGLWKSYHENGKLKEEVPSKGGKTHGIYKSYYRNGQLKDEVNYKDGVWVTWKKFDEEGNLLSDAVRED